ncbi:SpoIIE family protein phosphatase [Streptomyces sp. NPDC048002]|uniref:SpoIIE family protein phosphatase n=1 Tax=Streptomyces sp. NPDC048002 TaxID=3154344 RepID=UPI0034105E4F
MADVMHETGASAGLLYLIPPGDRLLWLSVLSGVSRQIASPWSRASLRASTPVADAIRQRRQVWLSSQEEVARRYPQLSLVLPYDFALAAGPFLSATEAWGGLALLWPVGHPSRPSTRRREAVAAYCRRTAHVLERAAARGRPLLPPDEPRYLPASIENADPDRAVAALRFTERLSTGCCSLDLDGRLTFVNAAGADLLGVDAACLLGCPPWEVLPWLVTPSSEEGFRAAMVTSRPTSFTATRPPNRPLRFQLYPDGSGVSVLITPASPQTVPVRAPLPEEAVGTLGLYHLTHVAAALAEAVTVKDVADVAADQIVPAFGPQGLVLTVADEDRLHIVSHRGHTAELISRFDGTSADSRTPTAHARAIGTPVFYSTVADFQRAYPGAPRYDNRSSWAFLPLTASGRRIGSLALSYEQPRPFQPAERALLSSLAGLVAQALDRARLYDAQHTVARTLQTSLLPPRLPVIAGLDIAARYQSAGHGMDIGGDFYDLIHTPGTVTAAIGDVQGHSTAAAALMGQVRTTVHAHATAGAPPEELLARANRLLTDLGTELFTSCLISQLDLARRRVRLASAGHPPPLLRHPDGRTEVLRPPPGLLLGIDPRAAYDTLDVPLLPGAVLTLYTDGLVEVPGADIDDTTNALAGRLAQSATRDLDRLADFLVSHAEHTAGHDDDIALLLIRPEQ